MTQEHDDTGSVATRRHADDARRSEHDAHREPEGRRRAVLALVAALVLVLVAGVVVLVATSGDDTPPAAAPAPRPAPAPAPRPAPAPSPLLGLVDAQFDMLKVTDLEQVFENSGNDGLLERGPLPQIVPNPDDPGRQAWRFTLGPGGKRAEVLPEGPGTRPTDGDVQWVRYSAVLDRGFPTTTDGWQLILQWHHDSPDGSPPIALQVTRGQLMMVAGGTDMKAISPVAPGQRVDLVMRIVFSRTPGRGAVTVWRDGRPTGVTDWRPAEGTMITRGAYLKMGLYRSTDIDTPGTVTATDLVVGPTARSVGGTGPLPPR